MYNVQIQNSCKLSFSNQKVTNETCKSKKASVDGISRKTLDFRYRRNLKTPFLVYHVYIYTSVVYLSQARMAISPRDTSARVTKRRCASGRLYSRRSLRFNLLILFTDCRRASRTLFHEIRYFSFEAPR